MSVILVSKDRPAYLSDALDSLVPQRQYINEILIFDKSELLSNSNQIEKLASDHHAILHRRHVDTNTSTLRNEGLSIANGEFMCFLDDDDYLLPDYITSQLSYLQNGASLVFCNYITVRYPQHPILPHQVLSQYSRLIRARIWTAGLAFDRGPLSLNRNAFAFISSFVPIIHGAMIRKEAIDQIRFSEQMVFCEDLHFWILFYKNNMKMAFNKSVLAIYRIHDSNWSSLFSDKHNFEFYSTLQKENAVNGKINLFLLRLKLFKFSNWGNRIPVEEKQLFWNSILKSIYLLPSILRVIPYFITLKYQNNLSRRN